MARLNSVVKPSPRAMRSERDWGFISAALSLCRLLLPNLGSKLLHYFSYSSPYISGSGSISMTLPFSIITTPVLC